MRSLRAHPFIHLPTFFLTKTIEKGSSMSPVGSYPTTEELIAMSRPTRIDGRSSKCLVYTLAILVVLLAGFLVVGSAVMSVRTPEVELRSAKLMHIGYSTSPSPSFNVSMIVLLTIKNPNFVGDFVYEKNTVSVLYRGTSVGVSKMGSGRVKAKEAKEMKLVLNIRSNKLLVPGILATDLHSRILKIRSYAKLNGTVSLPKIVKKRKTVLMACTMYLNLTSHSLHHFRC